MSWFRAGGDELTLSDVRERRFPGESVLNRLRGRSGSIGLGAALMCALVAGAVGSGYTASRSLLGDGSAWLTRGKGVVHVNGVTGRPDGDVARDLAKGDEAIQVVQTPDGHVYVVNKTTNEVHGIDLPRMDLDRNAHVAPSAAPGDLDLLAGGGRAYLVHRGEGRVETVDPLNLAVRGSVTVPGGIQDAVIDATGAVWVVTGRGTAVRIRGDKVEVDVEVGEPGAQLGVALVGLAPVVVDFDAGTVRRLDPDNGKPGAPVALPAGAGRVVLNAPGNPGPWLWAAQADGTLVRVDFERRSVAVVPMGKPGGSLGPPVVSGGRVHVPDYAHHAVVSVDSSALTVTSTLAVPGISSRFDAFLKDGAVWVNDPTGSGALVIDAAGRSKEVDKGGRPSKEAPPQTVAAPAAPQPVVPQRPLVTPVAEKPAPVPLPRRVPPPAPDNSSSNVVVPGVVGQANAQACAVVSRAGLSCQLVDRGRGQPVGTVVEQSPPPGSTAKKGSAVTVFVFGAKPQVAVPRVGRDLQQACAALRAARLQCVPTNDGRGGPVNKVTRTTPAVGSIVEVGAGVKVHYFGSPPAPMQLTPASQRLVSSRGESVALGARKIAYGGFRVILAGDSSGAAPVSVDDVIEVVVTRPDGSTQSYSHDYSQGCRGQIFPTGPQDLSSLFAEGANSVQVTLRDTCGTYLGSSDLWLVFSG